MIESWIDFLLSTQNADGGWGVERGKRSNTEATSFALLGLSAWEEAALARSMHRGLTWLTARQQADGSWPLTDQLHEGSWATAVAVLALTLFEPHRYRALRGADWLLRQKGRKLGWFASLLYRLVPQKMPTQLNPNLQGWPWTSGAFSWVEPTAYALMVLKKLRPFLQGARTDERIRQGDLLLYDRMCRGGGWNYGNVKVLGEDLCPYPDTTAVALIALQDHQAQEANQQSLHALQIMLTHVKSGLALSWSILCFTLYGHDVCAWRQLLRRSYEMTELLGQTKTIALALLALGDGARVFRG